MWNDRTKLLIGENGNKKLLQASVAIIGIGGVGGYVAVMLARAGVGKLTLVDFDVVDETNINRQIVANINTVGKLKTEVMKEIILQINPKCEVYVSSERFCAETKEAIFDKHYDFVVDAIDSVQDKVELINFCKKNDINIVSAMGAGNRIGIPVFEVVDIYKTQNDGLAKVMRKKLRERQIKSLDVVSCRMPAIKYNFLQEENALERNKKEIGSISYYPAMCGCVLSAYIIDNLLK